MKTESPSVAIAEFACAVCGARLDALHVDPGPQGSSICSFCGAPQPQHDRMPSRAAGPNGVRRMSLLETSDALGDARERRGESLDQVAEVTGIRRTYLEELESGSGWFDPYPGRVYGRFFLREYAEYLGLDPGPLLDAFDGEAEAGPTLAPTGWTLRRPRLSPSTAFVAITALVCLLALLGSSAILRGPDRDSSAFGPENVVPHVRRHDGVARAPARGGPVHGIRAVATISDRSWIEALSDGEAIYRATAPKGSVLTFRADRRLELTLGNAGGVALVVNGRPEPTGSAGRVVHLRFDLKGSRLTAAEI